jgi:ABC-2 type transport system permease protein
MSPAACGRAHWLGALGVAALTALAMTWVAMAMGLSAKAPEGASNAPMPVILLPFLGSGFVPATSMSLRLRQFAEYQPCCRVRGLDGDVLVGGCVVGCGHSGRDRGGVEALDD